MHEFVRGFKIGFFMIMSVAAWYLLVVMALAY